MLQSVSNRLTVNDVDEVLFVLLIKERGDPRKTGRLVSMPLTSPGIDDDFSGCDDDYCQVEIPKFTRGVAAFSVTCHNAEWFQRFEVASPSLLT